MAEAAREFRTQESLDAEDESRDAVVPFLESRGFKVQGDQRSKRGTAQSQVISAIDPEGKAIKLRVRLCWRKEDHAAMRISAAQLRARLIDNDWNKTLRHIVARDKNQGVTHALLFQRVGSDVMFAALVPVSELGEIWKRQRQVSTRLISAGLMGRVRKNHAANGSSPTIWLMDRRTPSAHEVPDILWSWPGVTNLVDLPQVSATSKVTTDDSWNDLPGIDTSDLGSDGAPRHNVVTSSVRRDPAVRRAVIKRAAGQCERSTCRKRAEYPGFLDVHHILGVERSDRVWNCVALCPNCHRDAHFAPDHDQINAELLLFSEGFK
ncbi:HNH endonuclease [Ralstonia sp. CHL-2022]|uniref:HNH endonuclease n=1 Tax=Ralstonia mojiangensis TaxID=2953895 RepID=A0ABT2LEZ7_9RALS|nr:HNH endonuclease signature motif containing protein [Ralstonia mojiangensis]MCT7313268.1 HNH endonuclease [Ralstonia mojiangensis]